MRRLICCAAILLLCTSSFAQQPAETSDEPPQPFIKIDVTDNLLSVEVSDAEFGDVIKEIADKAKFRVEISSSVAYKKISTSFKGVEIERGIRRLFSIIREKDYTISYNAAGLIDKIEIFGGANSKPITGPAQRKTPARPIQPTIVQPQKTQPVTPMTNTTPAPLLQRPRRLPPRPQLLPQRPPQQPQQLEKQPIEELDIEDEDEE